MKRFTVPDKVAASLKQGGVCVIPTDTVYGLVASALDKRAIARLYKIRNREEGKPSLVLISSLKDLEVFGVQISPRTKALLGKVWPGPVTVIIPGAAKEFAHLHPNSAGIAFRMPQPAWLRTLLKKTGPLIAPSANPPGVPPAGAIIEAEAYFGSAVDFYVDGGKLRGFPSSLIEIKR